MPNNMADIIGSSFKELVETFDLNVSSQSDEDGLYLITFVSENFVIKVVKYFKEFYPSLSKAGNGDDEINLYNLLEYLRQDLKYPSNSENFRKEKDLHECFSKQLNYISRTIHENYNELEKFFGEGYEMNKAGFDRYWKNKHPDLYRTI